MRPIITTILISEAVEEIHVPGAHKSQEPTKTALLLWQIIDRRPCPLELAHSS